MSSLDQHMIHMTACNKAIQKHNNTQTLFRESKTASRAHLSNTAFKSTQYKNPPEYSDQKPENN